jgi:hypothetical protein
LIGLGRPTQGNDRLTLIHRIPDYDKSPAEAGVRLHSWSRCDLYGMRQPKGTVSGDAPANTCGIGVEQAEVNRTFVLWNCLEGRLLMLWTAPQPARKCQ